MLAKNTLNVSVVEVGRIRVACLDRATTADLMIAAALHRRRNPGRPIYFTSANGQVLSLVASNQFVSWLFSKADLVSADGQPMVLASRLLTQTPLPERVATTDLFHDVAARAIQSGLSFYFLGASAEENAKAVAQVRARYPGLRIAGAKHGFFFRTEAGAVASEISRSRPDILWVAMGVPREQEFIVRNRRLLHGVGVAKTSGGLFNFLSGRRNRAPGWMRHSGLEWLYRTALEPRRLFWRYATTNVRAAYLLMVGTHDNAAPMLRENGTLHRWYREA
jgi:N-acetylglucosaminyldiphosphoundecaprenol N-acetyl-beta-D-mannosaminyltransferase